MMIQVSFHFYNILANAIGIRQVNKTFSCGTRILDAIQFLSKEYPNAFQTMLLPDGSISNYLKIFINGRLINMNEFNTVLNEGDEIMLFLAVSGG